MNKTQRYLLLFIGFSLLIFSSCKKKNQQGPNVDGIYGPLTIVTTLDKSADNIQFANGETVYFTSTFANDAAWKLTLTGRTSGAVKTFTGVGRSLSVSNALWDGTADVAPSFSAEMVDAVLTFPYSVNDTLTISLSIASQRNADANGVLVTNFNVTKLTGNGSPTGWPSDWPFTTNANTSYSYPDGTKYLYMTGYPWASSPYVDYVIIPAHSADTPYGTYFPLYSDPARVYFNVMVYNTGSPNTWLQINILEDGVATRSLNLKNINWTGWKLLSYNYLEIPAANPTATPYPNKITGVQFVLLSTKASPWTSTDIVTAAFDHVVFTHDRPFQP